MNNIFLLFLVAVSLWNAPAKETLSHDDSYIIYYGEKFTVEGMGLPNGTRMKEIRGWYINGYHIIPKEIKHRGAVVVFGGSDGACDFGSALPIASEGYEVYVMFFCGQENQRKHLNRVPLEFFAELYWYIQWTAQSPEPLTIHGYSKGTELSLLLASTFPDQVDHLILYAPLCYVFEGENSLSPWTFQGEDFPFIFLKGNEEMRSKLFEDRRNKKPVRGVELFQYGLEHDKNKEKARINLKPIRAKMLIFAGEWDDACPAVEMGREIQANYDGECELVIFEKAGHCFTEETVFDGWSMGGDPEANVKAKIESDRIRLEKLEEWTK